jgi:ATP-dependent helicase HrpB
MRFDTPLPIDTVLDELGTALGARTAAVLVAPPGAGKTTRVPLALLVAPWLGGKKILVLEPRRIAARAAADRMAVTLGEKTGETIGLRARMASKVGPKTRIEVVTEGVFTRMILDDPSLDGIGAVLFDEFHERSLDADLGLALALDAQKGLREDLRILVMSATLDGARVAKLLGDAPVIASKGRAYPVETRYLGRDATRRIDDQVADAVTRALGAETGSVLVFLPGQAEIRRVADALAQRVRDPNVDIVPLYGALDMREQDRAIMPPAKGRRKVVIATSIAETSLTIDGVRIVIDSGLARVPRFEPDVGVTRLVTQRVSRAAADQRRGRAGRTEPGVCYRMWDEPETQALMAFAEPEIRSADLCGLLLDCASWGVTDPVQLSWLDPPPPAAVKAALEELQEIGALGADGRITERGQHLRDLPLPPRLACMVVEAAARGDGDTAARVAAVLVERGLGGMDTDLDQRLTQFNRDRGERAHQMRRLAQGWAQRAAASAETSSHGDPLSTAALLALAYPDRIAKARGTAGQFVLANGRGAMLDATDPLARAPFLVVAELQGSAAATRILLAARLDPADLDAIAGDRIGEQVETFFDRDAAAVRARAARRLGAIVLASEPRAVQPGPAVADALADGLAARGIDKLALSKAQLQLRARVALLRASMADSAKNPWPDLSDAVLAETARAWLAPFLQSKTRASEIDAEDLGNALDTLIPWDLKRQLDADAPTHFAAPTGNHHPIIYEGPGAPSLAIRVQELFGLKAHPTVGHGKLPLTLELLSPAHRPIQITRDLPGFWRGSWADVRADMRGRYPKHVWPDDPANAAPTARAKPRGT